jgi:hypothetical protein
VFTQLLDDLKSENALGLLLAAQLGSSPSELTAVLRTTTLDAASGELTPIGYYTIQMSGVIEHQLTLGPFNDAALIDDHPLLYHHNAPGVKLFIGSPAADADAVLGSIAGAYVQVFGRWRQLTDDLNKRIDADAVLQNGMGVLGEFPQPFVDTISAILTEHGISHNRVEGDPKIGRLKLLAIDDSYFIARVFEVKAHAVPTENT